MRPHGVKKLQQNARGDEHQGLAFTRGTEALRQCRVLVVDDDDLVRARLSALLRTSEFDVETAATAEDALRILTATHCQILLTDWQMPDMDGLALCRNVRDHKNDSYVYVLMHTVRDSKEDLLTGLAAGVDDYLIKGGPIEELLARMEVGRRITGRDAPQRGSNRDNWRQSVIDPVTGTNNLRYLTKHLPRELARSRRYGHSLAILSCDVDGFKLINERHGYDVGDALLRSFVTQAEGCIRRESDWLARMSGDAFMIVLPETKVQGAHRVAQKLRDTLAQNPLATDRGPVNFTVSIGMTAIEPDGEHDGGAVLNDVLRAVDRGMSASKKRGGNHVTAAAATTGITIAVGSLMDGSDDIH